MILVFEVLRLTWPSTKHVDFTAAEGKNQTRPVGLWHGTCFSVPEFESLVFNSQIQQMKDQISRLAKTGRRIVGLNEMLGFDIFSCTV